MNLRGTKPFFLEILLGVLVVGCLRIWTVVYAQTPSGVVKVAVLNVGQGDAIYIESPTGEEVVIDGGPDDSLLRELPKVMPLFDRSLDAVIETHPDADHITGFVDLLARYKVGVFVEPGISKDTQTNDKVEQETASDHIPRYIARRGMALDLGGGAVLQILYPDHDVSHLSANMDNNGGIVARLVFGSTTALFTADVEHPVEDQLIALEGSNLRADLLKVGHHGSRTASEDAFIALVHPKEAIISVGANNMYHLPNQEPIDTLKKYGAEVLRTDQAGTIEFESDGVAFKRVP